MTAENVLCYIPGEIIAHAGQALPDPTKDEQHEREVVVDVPGRFRARIYFKRFHQKRGKMDRWFWTAFRADRLE